MRSTSRPTLPPKAGDVRFLEKGREAGGLCLLISSAQGVRIVPLTGKPSFVIGRSEEADIVIDSESISRKHARITLGDRITLEDLGSSNGTRADDRFLTTGEAALLRIGGFFEIGATTILLERERGLVAPARPSIWSTGAGEGSAPAGSKVEGPVVVDDAMRRLYGLLDVIGPSALSILILGETGVGKEIFAKAAHERSTRADRSFLQLNCAALPESLLEGELFGHEKGAFTGAVQAKEGLFEAADGGTVFLDEVGEIPLGTQAKLLRVLESGEVMRLGSRRSKTVDVRFVSATNRDLRALIADGRFRSDLYFRLNGMSVTLPPLRRRHDDIVPLAERMIARAAAKLGRRPPTLSAPAARALLAYDWPGNVRELRNVMERSVVMCTSDELGADDLRLGDDAVSGELRTSPPAREGKVAQGSASASLKEQLEAMEKRSIVDALEQCAGNQSKAAKKLGITRRVLIRRLELYAIPRPRKT